VFIRMLETGKIRQFSRATDRFNTNPVWSPDGSSIYYNVSRKGGVPVLYAARLEDIGFNPQQVFLGYPMPMRDASMSPDGSWIAFESWLNGVNHDIWIGMVSSARPEKLTSEESYEFDAAWQP